MAIVEERTNGTEAPVTITVAELGRIHTALFRLMLAQQHLALLGECPRQVSQLSGIMGELINRTKDPERAIREMQNIVQQVTLVI
jgi:hypothetical protein